MNTPRFPAAVALAIAATALTACVQRPLAAQDIPPTLDVPIYHNGLQSAWDDWSWADHDLASKEMSHDGDQPIKLTLAEKRHLFLHHATMDASKFDAITFSVDGGATGGQQIAIAAAVIVSQELAPVPLSHYLPGGVLPPNRWVDVRIPLSDLGVDKRDDFSGLYVEAVDAKPQATVYLDRITLQGPPVPDRVAVHVDARKTLRPVRDADLGMNVAIWDAAMDSADLKQRLAAAGVRAIRFPGGDWANMYDWTHPSWPGQNMTPQFYDLVTATHSSAHITFNYGSGSPQMAAAWVAYCDATPQAAVAIGKDAAGRDWKTAAYWASIRAAVPLVKDDGLNFLRIKHRAPFGFHEWAVGNENYGSWEQDDHDPKHDPELYAAFTEQTAALVRQIDPAARIGVVTTYGEDDWGDQKTTVTNPVTKQPHKGWTAVLLATFAKDKFVPDFVGLNYYPQAWAENDVALLQSSGSWEYLARAIRTMLDQYLGEAAASGVRILCTETNSVSHDPGKQSTSLVNALFYADTACSLMLTEFDGLYWWLAHAGHTPNNNNGPALYGWRLYGDYGILDVPTGDGASGRHEEPYPTYYALALLARLATRGAGMVEATSAYSGMAAYASRGADGGVSVLLINKHPSAVLDADVTVDGLPSGAVLSVYQYGPGEDRASAAPETFAMPASPDKPIQLPLPAYSLTLLQFGHEPAPARGKVAPPNRPAARRPAKAGR